MRGSIEAVLFVCDEPISLSRLQALFPGAKPAEIKEEIERLRADYEQSGRAFSIEEIAEGYQLLTRRQYADIIAALKKSKADRKISAAAIEVLAIIAYKQPIRRVDIEAIRGVQCGEVVRALMERGLVRIVGRDEAPGAPLLYGTTKEFLETFGLKSPADLPKPEELK